MFKQYELRANFAPIEIWGVDDTCSNSNMLESCFTDIVY